MSPCSRTFTSDAHCGAVKCDFVAWHLTWRPPDLDLAFSPCPGLNV